jgi:hypothetical protein
MRRSTGNRPVGRRRIALVALAVAAPLLFAGTASPDAAGFRPGDLFVFSFAEPPGTVSWFRADGTPVEALATSLTSVTGVEPDPSGRLWVTSMRDNRAVVFDPNAVLQGPIVDPFDPVCGEPTDLAFDAKGNAYIGDFGQCVGLSPVAGPKKFTPDGRYLARLVDWEADFVDLAADQCTFYWQDSNGETIYRRNLCTDGPRELVFSLHSGFEPRGVRLLPDGSLLSTERDLVVRITPGGAVLQQYDLPLCRWDGLALGVDASSFWSSCVALDGRKTPVELDVATGLVRRTLLGVDGVVGSVYGGFRAALDRTPPTVSVVAPAEGATYVLGSSVAADYACADAGGSELAQCAGDVPAGAPLDTSSVGAKTFRVTARDGAGNTASKSVSYTVVYAFGGFSAPIEDPPTVNVLRAGRDVRVPFGLGGNQGLDVLAAGYPLSRQIPCDDGALQHRVEQTLNARVSTLTFDARTGLYTYVFKTYPAWAKRCRELVLRLGDGTEHTARFKLK